MKRISEKRAKGTPDTSTPNTVPTNVEARSGDAARVPARHHADAVAVGMICQSRNSKAKADPEAETHAERDIWRRADDLAGSTPTPLIRSLAMTVALCEVDIRYRQAINGPLTMFVGRNQEAALNGSMRRYLAACRALATVQRLGLPPIQVNLVANQIVANG